MNRPRRRSRFPVEPVPAEVDSLSHDGRGVAHVDGKVVFIDGALPGEAVLFVYSARRRHHDEGRAVEVLRPAPTRVRPRCPHFGVCGGCSLQHMDPEAQILAKQEVLLENLERIGSVMPERILEPLAGPVWGYRCKARLSVKHVVRKGKVMVGFREKRSTYVADLTRCDVLHPSIGERLSSFAGLMGSLRAVARIAQIEVAVGEEESALVVRHLDPLCQDDLARLREYAIVEQLQIHLQPAGPESVHALWPPDAGLAYRLPAQNIEIMFGPTDFTQINPVINQALVQRVIELLDPQHGDRILDLFCGLGNLTLPLARHCREVVGAEADATLVERACGNAQRNGVDNALFHVTDLYREDPGDPWLKKNYDKVLIDPPRSGAQNMTGRIRHTGAGRVVYVSCHPASLARDAGVLVNEQGYRLAAAGVLDMFPHTAHVESVALFEAR
jgi:23S rRNA (uracil1939-C5)-methyltransferase